MSKGGSSTQSTTVDPQTQAYVDQMRRAALGYAGIGGGAPAPTGPASGSFRDVWNFATRPTSATGYQPMQPQANPAIEAAQAQYGQYANAGNLGLTALTGGANPFYDASQQQALNPLFAQARQQALGDIGQQATLQNAYGGSRHGVAEGQALGTLGAQQAGMGYQAYQDSLQRALQAAQLGFGAQAQSAFLPQQYASGQLGLLQQGMGPYGQTQNTQTQSDPFSQLLGLGLTGASLFFPPAAGLGAGMGLLGSPANAGAYG